MTKTAEIKKQIMEQAKKEKEPIEYIEGAYKQYKLEPGKHVNPLTKHEFTGNNVWALEYSMIVNGYTSCEWSTFAQYKADKKTVAKGQHGTKLTLAVFDKVKDENGNKKEVLKFFKEYRVFNKEQLKDVAPVEVKAPAKVAKVATKKVAKVATKKVAKVANKKTANVEQLNLWSSKYEVVA